jgi:hypothetical protein
LQIDWSIVENKLQAWSHLLRIGKRLTVSVLMNYVESGKTARTAGRGATATQLAERDARLDAEQVVSGGPDAWRHVYIPFCDALGPRAIVGLIAGRILMGRNTINLWAII